jgi:hypothetical protein
MVGESSTPRLAERGAGNGSSSTSHTSTGWSRGSALVSAREGSAAAVRVTPGSVSCRLESAFRVSGRSPATSPFGEGRPVSLTASRAMLWAAFTSRSRVRPQWSQSKVRTCSEGPDV